MLQNKQIAVTLVFCKLLVINAVGVRGCLGAFEGVLGRSGLFRWRSGVFVIVRISGKQNSAFTPAF